MNLEKTTKNDVSCKDDIVHYIIASPVDAKESGKLSSVGIEYLNNGEASYVLINLKQSTQFSSDARKTWVKFLQNSKIKKTAILEVIYL